MFSQGDDQGLDINIYVYGQFYSLKPNPVSHAVKFWKIIHVWIFAYSNT